MKTKIIIAVLLIICLVAFAGCKSGTKTSGKTENKNFEQKIGKKINTKEFDITLTSVYRIDKIKGVTALDAVGPEEGKELIILFFEMTNTSTDSEYAQAANAGIYGDVDGNSLLHCNCLGDLNEHEVITKVDPKKTGRVYVVYEVPKDWKEFEYIYGSAWKGKLASYKITPKDISGDLKFDSVYKKSED